jgi:hypothetical protein
MMSTSKVLAGGAAAATTAVLGSYFGLLGTVGGAAAGSVVTAVSSEIYQRSLDRGAARLRGGRGTVPNTAPAAPAQPKPGLSVGSIVFGSILVFVLGIAAVTGFEYLTGEPISGGDEGGTTLEHLTHLDAGSALGDLLGGSKDKDKGLLGGLLGL